VDAMAGGLGCLEMLLLMLVATSHGHMLRPTGAPETTQADMDEDVSQMRLSLLEITTEASHISTEFVIALIMMALLTAVLVGPFAYAYSIESGLITRRKKPLIRILPNKEKKYDAEGNEVVNSTGQDATNSTGDGTLPEDGDENGDGDGGDFTSIVDDADDTDVIDETDSTSLTDRNTSLQDAGGRCDDITEAGDAEKWKLCVEGHLFSTYQGSSCYQDIDASSGETRPLNGMRVPCIIRKANPTSKDRNTHHDVAKADKLQCKTDLTKEEGTGLPPGMSKRGNVLDEGGKKVPVFSGKCGSGEADTEASKGGKFKSAVKKVIGANPLKRGQKKEEKAKTEESNPTNMADVGTGTVGQTSTAKEARAVKAKGTSNSSGGGCGRSKEHSTDHRAILRPSLSLKLPVNDSVMDGYAVPVVDTSDPNRKMWGDFSLEPRHLRYSESSTGAMEDELPSIRLEDMTPPLKADQKKQINIKPPVPFEVPTRKWRFKNELCDEDKKRARESKEKVERSEVGTACPNNPFCRFSLSQTEECSKPGCVLRGGVNVPAWEQYPDQPNLFQIPRDDEKPGDTSKMPWWAVGGGSGVK